MAGGSGPGTVAGSAAGIRARCLAVLEGKNLRCPAYPPRPPQARAPGGLAAGGGLVAGGIAGRFGVVKLTHDRCAESVLNSVFASLVFLVDCYVLYRSRAAEPILSSSLGSIVAALQKI